MTQTLARARIPLQLDGVEHDCGGHFVLLEETRDVSIGQTRIPVSQQFYRCTECGEERQTLDQLDAARRAAASQLRSQERLLSGAEIRRIRDERLHITQSQLEKALGLGEKTVVRWETERVLQPKATDDLLRLLDRDPSALRYLADLHGVELPIEKELGDSSEWGAKEEAPCSLPIPKSYLTTIEQHAANEGLAPQEFVVWLLAEGLTLLRVHRTIEKMHADLADRMDTWKHVSFEWPAVSLEQGSLLKSTDPTMLLGDLNTGQHTFGAIEKRTYAQRA